MKDNHEERGDNMNIQKLLKEKHKDLVGTLKIQDLKNTILISGDISVSNKEAFEDDLDSLVSSKYPGVLVSKSITTNEFTVIEDTVDVNKNNNKVLDEVEVLYYGKLNVNHIKENDEYKLIHENNRGKLDNIIKVLDFIAPIVLDSDLKVIDGNFRLQLAKANDISEVLVVVIDDNDKRADFLRLALNRTSEFQRWNYRDVDDYVDSTPEAQPILEPIGFFGRFVLPESFFSQTVINYEIDPFNEKQKQYSQEEGLAEWAAYRREQMAKKSAEKRAKKPKRTNAVSLFDLQPKKEDLLETYDIDEEMDNFVDKYKEIAGEITDHVDAIKRAEIAEKGGVWQNTHRTSQEVAEENRAVAIENIQDSDILTEDEKVEIIENIEDYSDHLDDIEQLARDLRGDE